MKTVIVGKVSIRVWPDTKGFRKKLQADVKAAAAGVEVKVEVEPVVSATALAASVLRAVREVNALIKNNPIYAIRIPVIVEKDGIAKAARDVADEAVNGVKAAGDAISKELVLRQKGAWHMFSKDLVTFSKETAKASGRKFYTTFSHTVRELSGGNGRKLLELTTGGDSFIKLAKIPLIGKVDLGQARRDLRDAFQKIGRREFIRAKIWFDTTRFGEQFNKLRGKMRQMGAKIGNQFATAFHSKWTALQTKMHDFRVKVQPYLDNVATRWVRAELANIFDKTKTAIKAFLDKKNLAKVRAQLVGFFQKTKIRIKAILDNRSVRNVGTAFAALSGLRLTKTLFDPSILKNLDKMLPMIGLIATGIGQAIALISVMIQNILSLSASLAQIGPAALALPGIFTGLVVGAIAMGVALADINKRVPEIKAGLSRVANIIRAKFWTQAQAPMKELARRWMPIIETGMGKVARSGGAFFGNLANDLRKIVTPNLGGWFDAVAKGLRILKRGTPGIAKIVRGFGDLGAIYLPRFSRALASGLNRLGDWITKAVDSGAAMAWIDNAIFQIKELGRVIGNAWTFFKGLGKAAQAAGGTTLASLADSLGRLSEAVNSVSGQEKLIRFFKSMNDAMDTMYRTAGPGMTAFFESLNSLLPALMPLIGETAGLILGALGGALSQPEVGLGLIRFFDGLREALVLIGPSFNTIGSGLGALLGLLGTMATSFAPILKIALEGVGRSAEGIVLAVGNLISSLSSGVQAILIAIMPAIQKIAPLVTEFVNRLATQLGPFLERIAPIAGRVFEALAGALAKVLPLLSTLIDVLLPALEWAFRVLEPVITGALDAIGQLAEGLDLFIQGVAEMDFGKMWEGLKKALGSLITIFKAPLDAVTAAISGWANGIKARALAAAIGFLAQLVSLPGKIGAIFAALVALTKAKVEEMKAAIIAKATQMASDFARKIQDLKNGAVKIMRSVPDALKGALGNLGGLLVNSGKSLLDGLARGIRNGIGGAVRAATDAMGAIRRLFPSSPAKEGPFSGKGWTLYSGRAISASLAEGIRDDLSEARKASEELARAAQVPVSGASFGVAATRAVQSAIEAEARFEQDAPLTIGNLSIGPDDPEYAEFIEFARKLRRKARQAGG